MKKLTKKQRITLLRLALGLVSGVAISLFHPEGWWSLLYLIPYLLAGYDVLYDAVYHIIHGQLFDENFLMCIATIGAFFCGEYMEGTMVMVLYQVGELFQSVAVGRSRDSISALMALCPDEARVLRDGEAEIVFPDEVEVGETIQIHPGERVPLDGIVLTGESTLDTAPLTGESVPRALSQGCEVFSGCVNLSGVITVQVTKIADESSAARILELMESASAKKAKTEQFITRFAKVYTPLVCLGALLLVLIPGFITGNWMQWVYRAMTFLVISCPCALVISVPLSFFGGIGSASRKGILVKSGGELEKLAKLTAIAFDKTGTLTEGKFSVTEIQTVGCEEETLLELAAMAESASTHPLGRAVLAAYGKEIDTGRIGSISEQAGRGVCAEIDGEAVYCGSLRYLREQGVFGLPESQPGTGVLVARQGTYLGAILCGDMPRGEAKDTLSKLRRLGVTMLVMLTGDAAPAAEMVAKQLDLDTVLPELLPGGKVEALESLLEKKTSGYMAFVGDGINDAPVLRRADIGIAMGSMGSDAAIEAADVVLMEDALERIPEAVGIARKTMRIVRENIVFALGVKFLAMLLGAVGIANLWMAIFADVGVAILAILNACRLMKK